MLVRTIRLRTVRDIEEDGYNIFEIFKTTSVSGLAYIIQKANAITEEEAYTKLEEYIEEHTLIAAFNSVSDVIFGKSELRETSTETEDITTVTEMLNKFSMQLFAQGVSLTEFWDLDTRMMYDIVTHIEEKIIISTNNTLAMNHTLAALIGSAFAGKLKGKPPQIQKEKKTGLAATQTDAQKTIMTEEYGELDLFTYKILMQMKSMQ